MGDSVYTNTSRVKHRDATEIYYPDRVLLVGWTTGAFGPPEGRRIVKALRAAGLTGLVLPSLARARVDSSGWRQQRTRVCIVRDGLDGLEPDVICREIRIAAPWLDIVYAVGSRPVHPVERIAAHLNGCVAFCPDHPAILAAQAVALVTRHSVTRTPRGEVEHGDG